MWYVEVLVASATYHKDEPLTYSSDAKLERGRIVSVPLRNKTVMAVVSDVVSKPTFAAKPVSGIPDIPALPAQLLDVLLWMKDYYPAPFGLTVQLFLPDSLPKKRQEEPAVAADLTTSGPPLTKDQQTALDSVRQNGLHILHGDTGSGKTRVYLELAKRSFSAGKSSIILTPEIGLTSQLAQSFKQTFGDRVVLVHSGLTDAARRRTWQWVLEQKDPLIVIGARSALFSPLSDVGLVVVDESHETSYKQDQAPYYHATSVAAKLASTHGAALILGSATPLISDYYIATQKELPIIRMTQLAAASEPADPDIQIVDLKDKSKFTKSPHFSKVLVDSIKQKLQEGEQTLLFLNRRGTARVIFCEKCGWQAVCPHCDLPLVYHGDHHSMRCHSCSYKSAAPAVCPECKSTDIVFRSIGTKAIADEAHRLSRKPR